MAVSSTQTPMLRIIPYPMVHLWLSQCSSSHAKLSWHNLQFFPGYVKNNWNRRRKVRLSVGPARTDALQGYLEIIKERPMKTSEVE